MGQTWVCSSVCIAQALSLPYLLSCLLIFQSSNSPIVEETCCPLALTLPFRVFRLGKVSLRFLCRTPRLQPRQADCSIPGTPVSMPAQTTLNPRLVNGTRAGWSCSTASIKLLSEP